MSLFSYATVLVGTVAGPPMAGCKSSEARMAGSFGACRITTMVFTLSPDPSSPRFLHGDFAAAVAAALDRDDYFRPVAEAARVALDQPVDGAGVPFPPSTVAPRLSFVWRAGLLYRRSPRGDRLCVPADPAVGKISRGNGGGKCGGAATVMESAVAKTSQAKQRRSQARVREGGRQRGGALWHSATEGAARERWQKLVQFSSVAI